jgi:hypothetical protein
MTVQNVAKPVLVQAISKTTIQAKNITIAAVTIATRKMSHDVLVLRIRKWAMVPAHRRKLVGGQASPATSLTATEAEDQISNFFSNKDTLF